MYIVEIPAYLRSRASHARVRFWSKSAGTSEAVAIDEVGKKQTNVPVAELAGQRDLGIALQLSMDGASWETVRTVHANRLPLVRRLIPWVTDLRSGVDDPGQLQTLSEALFASDWIAIESVGAAVRGLPGRLDRALNSSTVDVKRTRAWAFVDHYKREFGLADDGYAANVVHYLDSLLRRYDVMLKHFRQDAAAVNQIRGGVASTLTDAVQRLVRHEIAFHDQVANLSMARLLRAQSLSMLGLREEAQEAFESVALAAAPMIDGLFMDKGAFTFGRPEGEASGELLPGITFLSESRPTTGRTDLPVILYSADIAFLKKYLYRLFFYASVNSEFHHHIHLVGHRETCEAFVDVASQRYRDVLDLRDPRLNINISWSFEPLPDDVADATAYYACARYMRAIEFVDHFKRAVWIQDVDAFPVGDVEPAVKKFVECDVALSISTRHSQFSPWRRYLAGNVYVGATEGAQRFFNSVREYIWHYRQRGSAWMLDQNALAWAYEKHYGRTVVLDTRSSAIPLTQTGLNSKIENLRRMPADAS